MWKYTKLTKKCHIIDCDNRMHENLFLDEPVLDLEKLEEDFANLVKETVKSDPENMISLNKVIAKLTFDI